MSLRASLVLRASALFAVWIWVVLIRNMVAATHDSWSFRLIHIALGLASLAFAGATWVITNHARRYTKSVEASRRPASSLTSVTVPAAAGALGRGIAARRRRGRPDGSVAPAGGSPDTSGVAGTAVAGSPPMPFETRD